MTKVIVTGANGYIAAHLVQQLLEKGYTVVGTLRSEEKGKLWKSRFGKDFDYEVVSDFVKDGAFDDVVKNNEDATVFLHTASPVLKTFTDRKKDVIEPAINGTTNALKAAHKYGKNIKHFVYTSSTSAVLNNSKIVPGQVVTEDLWNDVTLEEAQNSDKLAYAGSKTFAEKAAWDFVKNKNPQFTLTVVNPAYVFGPQAFDEDAKGELNFSAGIVGEILKLGKDDPIPEISGGGVDVRDVAKVHIQAFEKKETYGKRLIAKELFYNGQLILDYIRKNFPDSAEQLPLGDPGNVEEAAKKTFIIDNYATTTLLHYHWINLEQTVVDQIKQILKENIVIE